MKSHTCCYCRGRCAELWTLPASTQWQQTCRAGWHNLARCNAFIPLKLWTNVLSSSAFKTCIKIYKLPSSVKDILQSIEKLLSFYFPSPLLFTTPKPLCSFWKDPQRIKHQTYPMLGILSPPLIWQASEVAIFLEGIINWSLCVSLFPNAFPWKCSP